MKRDTTTVMTTRQVLGELGVPYWTLYGAMRANHVPTPATKLGPGYVWTNEEVDAARRYFRGRQKEDHE